MDRDALYFHFANLGLVIIGILSIQKIVGPILVAFLVLGTTGGFLFSWYIKNSRPPHIDTFIGMLSLASAVVVLSRLYETEISFENLLRIFSTALVWLSLFQAFGLKGQKSYSLLQFISASLLISSVGLALEEETVYVLYLAVFLFILIFAMRLDVVCEKQNLGSVIIGDREEVMSLWNQIKIGAIMFSIILMLSAIVYPAVPRFNSLSFSWIPSTLFGLPEKAPLLKLLLSAEKTIKDARVKKEQIVDDDTKRRETAGDRLKRKDSEEKKEEAEEKQKKKEDEKKEEEKKEEEKEEKTERFKARDFNKEIDAFKIESLTIQTDKKELPLDKQATLTAEIKLTDGSVISAGNLVDWKVTGTAKVSMDQDGKLTPKEEGYVQVSATYMGAFSNDVKVNITPPDKPKKKKGFLYYLVILLLWILALILAVCSIIIFIRSQRLSEMLKNNPREFIKEVYIKLCRAFKVYGMPKFDHVAYREFYNFVKEFISAKPEPMQALTEEFLEARFSSHEISAQNSRKAIQLFRDVRGVILEKEERNIFWKHFLFRISVLDVSLIPK